MKTLTRVAGALLTPAARAADALPLERGLTLIGWHRIGDAGDGLTTTRRDFVAQLDLLDEWGATVLPLDEAHRLLQEGRLPERAVALTFDDGYASVIEQAWPELRARGLPATLFAVSDFLDDGLRFPWDDAREGDPDLYRLATAAQLAQAGAEGLDVGSHTATHRWMPQLTMREVDEELRRSRADLEDLLQRPVTSFAYPMGGWNPAIRDRVERAGYAVGITVCRGRNRSAQDPLALRRAFAFDRVSDVRRQLDGGFTWMRLVEERRRHREPTW